MNTPIRSTISVQVRQPRAADPVPTTTAESPPVLDFIASDETLDRYGEVILPGGWDLRHYLLNPVFQNAHNYGSVIHTIGRAVVTEVRCAGRDACGSGTPAHLFQRIEFAIGANPLARIAYGLYKGGFLNAVSVGFVPLEWEDGTAKTPWRRRYLRQELLEVSAVGIPANPNALALGVKSGAIKKSDLRELESVLGGADGRPRGAPWLSTARLLRELLRRC